MKKESVDLTNKQLSELKSLEELPEDLIDIDDIPEVVDWSSAQRGVFYKPVKQQITLRLDADIIHWFRMQARDGRGYQTDMNRALRKHVDRMSTRTDQGS